MYPRVLREDYLVKVLVVPLSLRVEKGRQADNIATVSDLVNRDISTTKGSRKSI